MIIGVLFLLLGSVGFADTARLIAISSRGQVTPERQFIGGIAFSGNGSGTKPFLVRASGPILRTYGISEFNQDPKITIYRLDGGTRVVAENDNWDKSISAAVVSAGVGAFEEGSKDAGLVVNLPPGVYTANISSKTTGVVLLEVYDLDPSNQSFRISGVSTRSVTGQGNNVLIMGYVVAGKGTISLGCRVGGPALLRYGVLSADPDPTLSVYNAKGKLLSSNDDWGTDVGITSRGGNSLFKQVGLAPYEPNSKDAATVVTETVTVNTSATIHARSKGSTPTEVIAEVYELP